MQEDVKLVQLVQVRGFLLCLPALAPWQLPAACSEPPSLIASFQPICVSKLPGPTPLTTPHHPHTAPKPPTPPPPHVLQTYGPQNWSLIAKVGPPAACLLARAPFVPGLHSLQGGACSDLPA